MLTFNMITIWCLARLRLCSPVLFAVVAELGLLTELTTVFLPLGGTLDEEEEEDRPPSTESLSSKVLSATEAEKRGGYTRKLAAEFRNMMMTVSSQKVPKHHQSLRDALTASEVMTFCSGIENIIILLFIIQLMFICVR